MCERSTDNGQPIYRKNKFDGILKMFLTLQNSTLKWTRQRHSHKGITSIEFFYCLRFIDEGKFVHRYEWSSCMPISMINWMLRTGYKTGWSSSSSTLDAVLIFVCVKFMLHIHAYRCIFAVLTLIKMRPRSTILI